MILSHIAAMAKNRVIGKDNALPWSIPEDSKFFMQKTKGHILIMGRKTFESLGKPLPKRFHIVISRQKLETNHPDVVFVTSFEEALEEAKKIGSNWPEEVFIAGGGEIYKQTLPYTDRIYLTVIEKDIEGDAHYPEFNEKEFVLAKREDHAKPLPFSFRTYVRQKN
jgi:dihydrofolate reductase